MKKILSVLLGLVAVLALFAGCGGGGSSAKGLLTAGKLKVGSEIGYPPFEFFADDGTTPMGLDIDLAAEIAKELGVEVEFENTAWDGIFSGLGIDKYDVVISAVTITPERQQTMEFSTPYIENWQSIVVRKGGAPITSPEGLEGLNVGYQEATTSFEYVSDLIDSGALSCSVFPYDKVINCFDDLRNGRLDAVVADSTVSESYISKEPENFEISWHQKDEAGAEPERFGIAMKKGNTVLLEQVNAVLARLEENGKLDEIRDAWLMG
ncbi:MAG: transporter substrate-binding domain-containing protein [Oscillospiraceae bacterium]|nr:transporter substrate-binding domain-containing protein [Oscillospiraceae bacterium]